MMWQAAHLRVFCQYRAPVSSDLAARSSEKARATGSSAPRGAGAGTFSNVSRSPALAEALQTTTAATMQQDVRVISPILAVGKAHALSRCPTPHGLPDVIFP